eukprot:TRINITY_DN5683_c0_g1_i5.p3 TRINITY_DN5683_c0_g1~~TRINITY_DN5683_c0_g1_i5.p3  ORF type:complete len:187 (+),score=53.27 TRINITY_DN5683_c0_g1_i5:409-969(+)
MQLSRRERRLVQRRQREKSQSRQKRWQHQSQREATEVVAEPEPERKQEPEPSEVVAAPEPERKQEPEPSEVVAAPEPERKQEPEPSEVVAAPEPERKQATCTGGPPPIERRIDPVDGRMYTYQELAQFYRGWYFSPYQIKQYWEKNCRPVQDSNSKAVATGSVPASAKPGGEAVSSGASPEPKHAV